MNKSLEKEIKEFVRKRTIESLERKIFLINNISNDICKMLWATWAGMILGLVAVILSVLSPVLTSFFIILSAILIVYLIVLQIGEYLFKKRLRELK